MITTFQAIVLGIVQGITEFLPISSSGHLVIFQSLFGLQESPLLFDVILHLGTLIATCIVFRKKLMHMIQAIPRMPTFAMNWFQKGHLAMGDDIHAWMVILVLTCTLVTGTIGILFHDFFEKMFSSNLINSITLFITGIILFVTRNLNPKKGVTAARCTLKDSVLIGLAQALAILPGISRSGSTIATGLWRGFSREFAGEFSFIVSIPAIMGAIVLESLKADWSNIDITPMLIGFTASLVLGYISLSLLIGWIRQGKLVYFSYYCMALGVLSLPLAFK